MRYHQYFGDAIWTYHAIDRMKERGLSQQMAWEALRSPDWSRQGKQGGTEFQKRFGATRVSVIAKQNDKREWIVLSCWMDPPQAGTLDHRKQQSYQRYKEARGAKKILLAVLRQLGVYL